MSFKVLNSQKAVAFWAAFQLALMPLFIAPAHANGASENQRNAKQTPSAREVTKEVLEHVRSKEDVLNVMANAGVSIESMKIIEADLNKRFAKKIELPKMTLAHDEIHINGKASGIKIISYSPFKVKYQSRIWAMNPDKPGEENYQSIVSFLEKRHGASATALFFPEANAWFDDGLSGAIQGGLIGAVGGTLFGMATGSDTLTSLLVGGGIGAVVGGLYGHSNYQSTINYQQMYNPTSYQSYSPNTYNPAPPPAYR